MLLLSHKRLQRNSFLAFTAITLKRQRMAKKIETSVRQKQRLEEP